MKITKQYLKQIIKEELEKAVIEGQFKKGFRQGDYMDTIMNDEETVVKKMLNEPPTKEIKQLVKSKLVNNPKMSNAIKGQMINLPEQYILMIKSGGLGKDLQDYYNNYVFNKYKAADGSTRAHKYASNDTEKFFGLPPVTKAQFTK